MKNAHCISFEYGGSRELSLSVATVQIYRNTNLRERFLSGLPQLALYACLSYLEVAEGYLVSNLSYPLDHLSIIRYKLGLYCALQYGFYSNLVLQIKLYV